VNEGAIYPVDREVTDPGEQANMVQELAVRVAFKSICAANQNADEASSPISGPRNCVDCGGEIDPKRIEAMPGAKRCVLCQSKADLLEKSKPRHVAQGVIHRQKW
jgi:RNA polymerase-binding transcription factor DksA